MPEAPAATPPVVREALARLESASTRHETRDAGRRIVWRRFGSGPALVLLHGGHGSWLHWLRNIEALSREHTLWLLDMPGYGDSDRLDAPSRAPDAMERLVDALASSLASLPGVVAPVDLAGFSFGGFVAARLAARGLARRLALVGPAGHGSLRRQAIDLIEWRSRRGAELRAALRHNLATLMLHDPAQIDELALTVYELQVRAARFHSKSISQTGGLPAALAAFAGPVLLLWGEHDITAVPHELAPRQAAARHDATWCIVAGAGHWVQYERADEVSRLLAQWFDAR